MRPYSRVVEGLLVQSLLIMYAYSIPHVLTREEGVGYSFLRIIFVGVTFGSGWRQKVWIDRNPVMKAF